MKEEQPITRKRGRGKKAFPLVSKNVEYGTILAFEDDNGDVTLFQVILMLTGMAIAMVGSAVSIDGTPSQVAYFDPDRVRYPTESELKKYEEFKTI
jgi:hypothetical protein